MSLVHRAIQLFTSEFRRLFAFGLIGLSSLGLVIGLYALVSRVLWINGPKTVEYTIVNIFVTWLNYEANRHFTFQKQQRNVGSVSRFILVAAIATGLNSILFWLGHELLHIVDFYVIVANAFIVAAFTFTSHRVFTFHERPWRWIKREVVNREVEQ